MAAYTVDTGACKTPIWVRAGFRLSEIRILARFNILICRPSLVGLNFCLDSTSDGSYCGFLSRMEFVFLRTVNDLPPANISWLGSTT
jgi:hypothetical protein